MNMIKKLTISDIQQMMPLARLLNPKTEEAVILERLHEIFQYTNYHCFGWVEDEKLVAMCGTWTMTKLYSGKQLEVDNFAVAEAWQSKRIGSKLMEWIETWCQENDYQSIELNAYVRNGAAHKFYFRLGYSIAGFHFIKKL